VNSSQLIYDFESSLGRRTIIMTVHSAFILGLFLVRIIDRDAHKRRNVVSGSRPRRALTASGLEDDTASTSGPSHTAGLLEWSSER